MNVLALSERKRIFLKTKKADQKHCENWRMSLVQNSINIPKCSIEVIGENSCVRDFITQSFKQSPIGSGTISSIFWPNGSCMHHVCIPQ